MPELPEVETTRLGLLSLLGQSIKRVEIKESRLRFPVQSTFAKWASGQEVLALKRRAKYLILELPKGHVLIHLGMSGHLQLSNHTNAWIKHEHVRFTFTQQVLSYHDTRRFGSILYTESPLDEHPLLGHLGPEPLEPCFNSKILYQSLHKKRCDIKVALMDQKVVVGVGNIYASESLFAAGISPLRQSNTLTLNECQTLCKKIKSILNKAIQSGGTTLKDFKQSDGKMGYFQQQLRVYGQNTCAHCSSKIQKITQAQRATYYCENCQNVGFEP